ncbi:hypothetical protein RI129_010198 [Pyrocoelia pectoralis]|uniref:Uncharacterized protein n=1 Tax=Pyrocoelia pectoralis TaxID=417401 RepID=A0AAN7VA09_9COLE
MRSKLIWLGVIYYLTLANSLPTSLVEDVKANSIKENKVKRARSDTEENSHLPAAYYKNPTAIKRGTSQPFDNWEALNKETFINLAPSLYSNDGKIDEKSIIDYEKAYQYGTNKEKLDEALENAVLKSELYGNPGSLNQYRYFEGSNDEKRKKRAALRKLNNRYKRDVELTPEEFLTLLSLWENERRHSPEDYRPTWSRYEPNMDLDDRNDNEIDEDDENWLDTPVVYPHATNRGNPNYIYEDKRGEWGRFPENKKKRFMVARKRNDPTRELRYINGPPQRSDYYTLSQLLASQREPNAPLYHRMVL